MSPTVLVHTKGWGSSFQCDAHRSIASSRSATDVKLVLVSALRVRTENHPSMRLSHDAEAGVKCRCHRWRLGRFGSQGEVGVMVASRARTVNDRREPSESLGVPSASRQLSQSQTLVSHIYVADAVDGDARRPVHA